MNYAIGAAVAISALGGLIKIMNTTVDNETNQTTPNQEETSPVAADATPEVTTDAEPEVSADASRDAALEQLDTSEEEALETEESMENLMDMYEESFKRFAEGEVVTGKIISVDKDHVLVDIGYKSEGQISINEFRDENGDIKAEVDDRVEVMVEWWDDENEVVVLSKEKAEKVKVWEEIKKSYDADEPIQGTIVSRV